MRALGTLSLLLPILVALPPAGCVSSRTGTDEGPGSPAPGPGPGPGTTPGPTGTLAILPPDLVLQVDGKTPVVQAYRVITMADGKDVSAQASLWLDDGRFGQFSGSTFTSNPAAAGKTMVRARLGDAMGATSLTLRVRAVVLGPGAPAGAPGMFGGPTDMGRAPALVYPPDGVLVPPNLNDLEFQWQPQAGTDLYQLAIEGDSIDLRIYTPCVAVGAGCALAPDPSSWALLAQAGRGQSVKVTVLGTSTKGGGVGASATQRLSFGDEDILGGIYYWSATAAGIYRYDFGLSRPHAEAYYVPLLQAGAVTCVGCHAMSRNGKRIAAGLNIPGPALMRALDVATRNKLFEVGTGIITGSNYQAWNPDGSRLVTTENGGLTLRNGDDGTIIGANPQVRNANMPDFSPDGTQVVFARQTGACTLGPCTLSVQTAGLYLVPFAKDSFGMPRALVPEMAGQNSYYPSFSPDGGFVAFNRSAGDSYDAADAKVMIVPAAGGTAIDLASINKQVGNSWPKWAPFVQHFQGATIMWLTFSSRRDYGLHQKMQAQLWMVPVDPARLKAGMDPAYPPFWLPFQDIATGNHIAQWVEKVERQMCTSDNQCPKGEFCEKGVCLPVIM